MEEHFPYAYNHFEEPVTPPYISRLLTTLSYSYTTKVLPVHDYKEETVEDSVPSASKKVPQAVPNSGNELTNKGTTKKDTNVGTNTSLPSQGSVKVVTPKPNIQAESVTKSNAETKAENKKKTANDKTTEPDTNPVETKVSENNVDVENKPVDAVIQIPDAEGDTTPENSINDTTGQTDEVEGNVVEATTDEADVPATA